MQYVENGSPFSFNYGAWSQDNSLNVAGNVYEIVSGVPTFVEQVAMTDFQDGVYSGSFTGEDSAGYLVIAIVYTDNSYTTPDTAWSPSAEIYQQLSSSLSQIYFNYATYDQNAGLFIAGNIQGGDQIPMDLVDFGVYFGAADGAPGTSYTVATVVYTDNTYLTPASERSPGADSIVILNASGGGSVSNVLQQATLVGQGPAGEFQDITISQGDTAELELLATTGPDEIPFDLTGATLTTFIRGPIGAVVSFPNSQHTINSNQSTNRGQFSLSLSSDDTEELAIGPYREIITEVVQSSSTIYFHGFGVLTVLPNVPVQ